MENFKQTQKRRTINVTLLLKQSVFTNLDYSEASFFFFLDLEELTIESFIADGNDPGERKNF